MSSFYQIYFPYWLILQSLLLCRPVSSMPNGISESDIGRLSEIVTTLHICYISLFERNIVALIIYFCCVLIRAYEYSIATCLPACSASLPLSLPLSRSPGRFIFHACNLIMLSRGLHRLKWTPQSALQRLANGVAA
ncbi:hypothetical protein HDV62DRAFT_354221 [Trichoderma sp. SZMC 28011]